MNIDRRDALAGIVAMFGASLFAPIARAAVGDVTPISVGAPTTEVFTAPQRALMTALAGLDAIEARSQADYNVAAARATPEQQDALLTLAMEDRLPGGKDFFEKFRQLVITGYFTSEIGIT